MPLFTDWTPETENGLRFIETTDNPLNGPYSLHGFSDGTEFDVVDIGFRKSASVYLRDIHPRGFSDGRIRTLFRMENLNASEGWGGIFFLSSKLGIGTRLETDNNHYEVSNEDNTLKIVKVVNNIKTTLVDTLITISPATLYGIDVSWEFDPDVPRTFIEVKLGNSVDFNDLVTVATFSDTTDPHQFSDSEGLFVQAESSEDLIDIRFDTTSIFRIVTL